MKQYTTSEWHDVGRNKPAVVVIDSEGLPDLGEDVEINGELFNVRGIEKDAIHIENWEGKTVGLLVEKRP